MAGVARGVAADAVLLAGRLVVEEPFEQGCGRRVVGEVEGDAVEAADRKVGLDPALAPGRALVAARGHHQRELQAIGVLALHQRLAEARGRALDQARRWPQTLAPERQAAVRDREVGQRGLADAGAAAAHALPREEGHRRAGRAGRRAVVEVIDARVVEIDGLLDEAQPQHLGVEVEVALRRAADRGDVVEAFDVGRHGRFPWLITCSSDGAPMGKQFGDARTDCCRIRPAR